jgi:hypothetical protein
LVLAIVSIPAETAGAAGVIGVTEAARSRGAIVLEHPKGRVLRRAVARRVNGVRWVNRSAGRVERLAMLEEPLMNVRTAEERDVNVLRAARADARTRGIFAQLFRRGGTTLAVIEAPNRVVRRLKRLRHTRALLTGKPAADGDGCDYNSRLSLPADGKEVHAREIFTSFDGCLTVTVYEVDP